MKDTYRSYVLITLILLISSCSNLPAKANAKGKAEWDFDHKLQFRLTSIGEQQYQLEILRNNKTKFARMSAFLIRKSYRICGNYHYQLEIQKGIESFDDKRAMPNYIFPSLVANIYCQVK